MPAEGHCSESKSLRKITGKTADFAELAQDCVCFANGSGGQLLIGVEDGEIAPPAGQRVDLGLLDRVRKRIGELTVNVEVLPELRKSDAGDEYIVLTIPRSIGVASTSDGRYFVRVGDTCRPVVGDDVLRLADERPATPWESMTSLRVSRGNADKGRLSAFTAAIRASDRVKASVKEKADGELLDHYGLARADALTKWKTSHATRVQRPLKFTVASDPRFPSVPSGGLSRSWPPKGPSMPWARDAGDAITRLSAEEGKMADRTCGNPRNCTVLRCISVDQVVSMADRTGKETDRSARGTTDALS